MSTSRDRKLERRANERTAFRATRAGAYRRLGELQTERQRVLQRLHAADAGHYTPLAGGQMVRLAEQRTDIPYAELWAEVHWTEDAAEMIRSDEYRYISPEFNLDHVDPATGDRIGAALLAIGLTNRPFLKGMARVEDPDDANVSRIQVFATGEWHHEWYGRITIEERHLQEMVDNRARVMNTMPPDSEHDDTELMVDYNHMSLMGGPDESKAAGWVRGQGIYLVRPAQDTAAQEPAEGEMLTTPPHGVVTMKDARIRELLNLQESVEITNEHRDQALDALDAKLAEGAPAPEPVAAAEPPAAGTVALSEGEVATLREMAAEGAKAAQTLRERDARDAVAAAIAAKKVLPAQQAWAEKYALRDPDGFRELVEASPARVDDGRTGSSDPAPTSAEPDQIKAFIDAKVAAGTPMEQAHRDARQQFGEKAWERFRFPNKQQG